MIICCIVYHTYGQNIDYKIIKEYNKNKVIYDVKNVGDTLWLLTNNSLVRFHRNDIREYHINSKKNGSLNRFTSVDTTNYFNYEEIKIFNNILYLLDKRTNTLSEIINDTIFNIHLRDNIPINSEIIEYIVEENDLIWFVLRHVKTNDYNIYKYHRNIFKKMDYNLDKHSKIINFFIFNNFKYILTAIHYKLWVNKLFIIDSNNISTEIQLDENETQLYYKSQITGNILNLFNNHGLFFKVKEDTYKIIQIDLKISSCFSFYSKNNLFFISQPGVIFCYNIESNKYTFKFLPLNFVYLDNILVLNDNLIGNFVVCGGSSSGLEIISIKEFD